MQHDCKVFIGTEMKKVYNFGEILKSNLRYFSLNEDYNDLTSMSTSLFSINYFCVSYRNGYKTLLSFEF